MRLKGNLTVLYNIIEFKGRFCWQGELVAAVSRALNKSQGWSRTYVDAALRRLTVRGHLVQFDFSLPAWGLVAWVDGRDSVPQERRPNESPEWVAPTTRSIRRPVPGPATFFRKKIDFG